MTDIGMIDEVVKVYEECKVEEDAMKALLRVVKEKNFFVSSYEDKEKLSKVLGEEVSIFVAPTEFGHVHMSNKLKDKMSFVLTFNKIPGTSSYSCDDKLTLDIYTLSMLEDFEATEFIRTANITEKLRIKKEIYKIFEK